MRAFLMVVAVVLPLVGVVNTASAQSCQEFQGAWKNTEIGHPDPNDLRAVSGEPTLVLEVRSDCSVTGSFDGRDYKHSLSGSINGPLVITRTDPRGCTNRLFGRLYEARRGILIPPGFIRELRWEITSSEPKCGMGSGHREKRAFERP